MANRLAAQSSPYLLQHADNPVDWYPWGQEAFARARADQKPILLSIGYSSCHWCHVMAHESFEDPATAARLNEGFVCIKVDREERPDVDQLYQTALALMGEPGGWPLTLFLTPKLEPFFGGTYFPGKQGFGRPAFTAVLASVREAWERRRAEVEFTADWMGSHLGPALAAGLGARKSAGPAAGPAVGLTKGEEDEEAMEAPTREQLVEAGERLAAEIDPVAGGFGEAPKFPSPAALALLLRAQRRGADPRVLERALLTLDRMAAGGLYDQLGGGFHRYAVDGAWHIPHFEKMLYDNAQLLHLYTEGWLVRRTPRYAQVVSETVGWLERELLAPEGGFHCSLDADSPGGEGRFYSWRPEELAGLLGRERAELLGAHLGVEAGGNFEDGLSVPRIVASTEELAARFGRPADEVARELRQGRAELLAARDRRPRPGRDEKILAGWNGLAIRALARAARAFERPEWAALASRAADFVLRELVVGGVLWRSWRAGVRRVEGQLEDYGDLAEGLVELYQATLEPRWLVAASELAEAALDRFWDEDAEAFLASPANGGELIARVYASADNAWPAGASTLCNALVALAGLTSQRRFLDAAWRYLARLREPMLANPQAHGRLLCAADAWLDGAATAVVAGDWDQARGLLAELGRRFEPTLAVAWADPATPPPHALRHTLGGKTALDGKGAVYLCRHLSCQKPAAGLEALEEQPSG